MPGTCGRGNVTVVYRQYPSAVIIGSRNRSHPASAIPPMTGTTTGERLTRRASTRDGYATIAHASGTTHGTPKTVRVSVPVYTYSPNGTPVRSPSTSTASPPPTAMTQNPSVHANPRHTQAWLT